MSASHSIENTKIQNPGSFQVSFILRLVFLLFVGVGIFTFILGLKSEPSRAWASFVHNHFYFMSLALGGIFFATIQWITGAMWSAPIRRLAESFTFYLPVVLISFIVLTFGIPDLYIWSHIDHVQGDLVLQGKSGYLSTGFFTIRNLIAIALWMGFSFVMIRNSILQDRTQDIQQTLKNRFLSPVFLIIFAITFTMASFDQLMSLDPHWFSTMFGVYCFAGLFYSTLAAICLLTLYLRSQGKLKDIVNENHLHDLGKFMFAFTVFWAYIGFSQFMLIWYANLPEETGYFMHRLHGGWKSVSFFLFLGKFLFPFFMLLPRDSKRNPRVLTIVGIFMLCAQWVDMLWVVQPEFFAEGPNVGLLEIGISIGFLGTFCLCVSLFLSRFNIVAIGDPKLIESVFHHHQ